MAYRNGRRNGGMSSRRRFFVRLALAAAIAALIIARYTSPRSIFHPISNDEPTAHRR
jgi:hypothetical protein